MGGVAETLRQVGPECLVEVGTFDQVEVTHAPICAVKKKSFAMLHTCSKNLSLQTKQQKNILISKLTNYFVILTNQISIVIQMA